MDWVSGCPGPFQQFLVIARLLIWLSIISSGENMETCGYGSIPIDTFLVGWTSIYQLFWGSLGTRVLTHPHVISIVSQAQSTCFPEPVSGQVLAASSVVRSASSRPFGSTSRPFGSPWIHIRRILKQCIWGYYSYYTIPNGFEKQQHLSTSPLIRRYRFK